MSTHTQTHTDTQTHMHTYKHDAGRRKVVLVSVGVTRYPQSNMYFGIY